MNKSLRVYVTSGAAVIAFDLLIATISHFTHYGYSRFYVATWLLNIAIGILATRNGVNFVGVGAFAGFVDSSLGWWLALQMKPTTNHLRTMNPVGWALVALIMVVSAVFFAGVGSVFGTRLLNRIWPAKLQS